METTKEHIIQPATTVGDRIVHHRSPRNRIEHKREEGKEAGGGKTISCQFSAVC